MKELESMEIEPDCGLAWEQKEEMVPWVALLSIFKGPLPLHCLVLSFRRQSFESLGQACRSALLCGALPVCE